jgi:DUF1680 family protein
MFVGSRIHVGQVAGTNVEIVQKTDYPWNGLISISVNPEEARTFSVHVRIPDRTTSKLYKDSPLIHGMKKFTVNDQPVTPSIEKGYAVVTREWKAGDRIELVLPMEPQRVTADDRIMADSELVALKYGPLIYNVETADNNNLSRKIGAAPLQMQWRNDLLGGIMVITGKWADGSKLVAIPNYARMNRVGAPHAYPSDEEISTPSSRQHGSEEVSAESKVWV